MGRAASTYNTEKKSVTLHIRPDAKPMPKTYNSSFWHWFCFFAPFYSAAEQCPTPLRIARGHLSQGQKNGSLVLGARKTSGRVFEPRLQFFSWSSFARTEQTTQSQSVRLAASRAHVLVPVPMSTAHRIEVVTVSNRSGRIGAANRSNR